MMTSLQQLKAAICDIGRRAWQRQFVAGFDGNISVRLGKGRFLCTPTGVSKGSLVPARLCEIDDEGKLITTRARGKSPAQPTSEILLHLQIFHRRPDVQAVVHAHPPHATAFACAGVPLPEGFYPEADAMLGRVVTVPYTTPGYKELGASVAAAIDDETNTVILGNHGTVHFGPTLEDAYCYLEVLDAYCRILLMLKQLGQVLPLTPGQWRDLMALKALRGMPDRRHQEQAIGPQNAAFMRGMRRSSQ